MLSRVANNLFWMGRYLERTEHIARFINVNYFSSVDAPDEISKSMSFVLKSLVFMADKPVDSTEDLKEETVLYNIGLNPNSHYSIKSVFSKSRANASSSRDLLSLELFEEMNQLHYTIENFSMQYFVTNGLDEFTTLVIKGVSSLRGKIRETLIHDEAYAIISIGIELERAFQVIRIINTKYHDALSAVGGLEENFETSYEWSTLLKCVQSFDMMKRYYKSSPKVSNTFEFLMLNPNCPRSIISCFNRIKHYLDFLSIEKEAPKFSTEYLMGKLTSEYYYKSIDDIKLNYKKSIREVVNQVELINNNIHLEFF